MLKSILIFLLTFLSITVFPQEIYYAELINYETTITFRNGKLITNNLREIVINRREGEKYTKVQIPFSGQKRVVQIEAYIKDVTGQVVKKLQKNDIVKRSEISNGSLYEDSFVYEFELKHNQYPYTVFINYQVQEDEFIHLIHWVPVVNLDIPTRKAALRIEAPEGFRIRFRYANTESLRTDTTETGLTYLWTASYSDIIKPEIFSPHVYDFIPNVHVVPENFRYDHQGSLRTWIDYGDWQYNMIESLSDLTVQEKYKMINLVEGINDPVEKIRKLYQYLQDNTRYINITIETGGLKPYPASYVALNKYGDCKALTNYFKAVLDAAGLKSFYSTIIAGDQIRQLYKEFPAQQFNHAILCIPVVNDTIWLDCTSKLPFGYTGTFIQGREALVIEKNKSHFSKIPSLTYSDVLEKRKVVVTKSLSEPSIAFFSNTYCGKEYETLEYISQSVRESEKHRMISELYVEPNFELLDYNLDSNRTIPSIRLSYTAESQDVYKTYNDVTLINVLQFNIPIPEEPHKRKLPVKINYPVFKSDTIDYQIPTGFEPDTSLLNKLIVSDFGEYKIKTFAVDKNIRVIKSFKLKEGLVEKAKYGEFYSFLLKIKNLENNNKIITRKKDLS